MDPKSTLTQSVIFGIVFITKHWGGYLDTACITKTGRAQAVFHCVLRGCPKDAVMWMHHFT